MVTSWLESFWAGCDLGVSRSSATVVSRKPAVSPWQLSLHGHVGNCEPRRQHSARAIPRSVGAEAAAAEMRHKELAHFLLVLNHKDVAPLAG
jgi:hypothetical protein